jgi:hypothetical protein
MCWLYAPDEVIQKGYVFLETVQVNSPGKSVSAEEATGNFVANIRLDMLMNRVTKATRLKGTDYKHLQST